MKTKLIQGTDLVAGVVVITIVSFLLSTPGFANTCNISEPVDVEIDANTGKLKSDKTAFSRNAPISYAITGMNPFKYTYTHSVDIQVVNESGTIDAFLRLLSPLTPLLDPLGDENATSGEVDASGSASLLSSPPTGGAPPPSDCAAGDQAFYSEVKGIIEKQEAEAITIAEEHKKVSKQHEDAKKQHASFVAAVSAEPFSCPSMVEIANKTRSAVVKFKPAELPRKMIEHAEKAKTLKDVLDLFPAKQGCASIRSELLTRAELINRSSKLMLISANQMVAEKKKTDGVIKLIDDALKAGFYATGNIPARRTPAIATINVTRKARQPNSKQEIHKIELKVGRPFFTLSAGIGLSSIKEQEFGRVASFVTDESDMTSLGQRIAVTDRSSTPALGVVLLTANIKNLDKHGAYSFGWSTGVSVGSETAGSRFGYLTGPSIGFLEDSFFATLAYHTRKVDVLSGGFSVDDPIPESLGETLPLTSKSKDGIMLVISYKIR